MIYALSAYPFTDFLQEYQFQQRGITEQILQLSCIDKTSLFNALQVNNTDSKRFYNYYFHQDNCTSRAKDMIVKNASQQVFLKISYRLNLLHSAISFISILIITVNTGVSSVLICF